MDAQLRPDLGKILPLPWTRQIAGRDPSLHRSLSLSVPAETRGEDFLVEVERHEPVDADTPALGLRQAAVIARRLALVLAPAGRTLHRLDAERAQRLAFDP